jgi:hypothetical protein
MSLRSALLNSVEDLIQNFSNLLADKFNLDRDEVLKLWDEKANSSESRESPTRERTSETKPKATPSLTSIDTDDISMERLMKATKPELSALCKARCIKSTGKKEELIERLLEVGKKKSDSKTSETKTSQTKTTQPKLLETKKTESKARDFREMKKNESKAEVIQKITATTEQICIRRSKHGNYIHPDSKLVFNSETKNVIGKEEDDGTISELCDEDIETCKKYKFTYTIPNNLDKAVNIDNVKVDELEELEKEVEVDEDIDEAENDDEEVVELEDD